MRQLSWQAIARGADTVQFFQLRQSRGGCEKFHGAVISASGSPKAREYREVAELGAELGRISGRVGGSVVEHGRVGVVFDWNSWWGINYSAGPSRELDYVREVERWYTELHRRSIAVDILPATGPFTGYDVIVAPCLYMLSDDATAALRAYVEGGGRLVLTPMSALVDLNDLLFQGEAPVPLRDLAGIWIEETDALPPTASVTLAILGTGPDICDDEGGTRTGSGEILADVVHPDPGTQILATYASGYYAGTPALTFRPSTGTGGVFYAATFPGPDTIGPVLDTILDGTGIESIALPDGVHQSRRIHDDGRTLTFLINTTGEERVIAHPPAGTDLTTGAAVVGPLTLGAYGVAVIEAPPAYATR